MYAIRSYYAAVELILHIVAAQIDLNAVKILGASDETDIDARHLLALARREGEPETA